MSSSTPRSAAHIVIRRRPPSEAMPLHARLAPLLASCGTNKHDRATVLISAAISEGVNTGSAIVALGGQVGLNKQHVGFILQREAGSDPVRHHWRRDERGIYHLLS